MTNKKKLEQLQQDLRNGMGLEEALQKHELSFYDAVIHMPRPLTKTKKKKRRKR